MTGPWVPMSTSTGVFKEPKHHHNMPLEPHQPMMYKVPTTQGQFYTNNLTKYIDAMFPHGKHGKPEYFIKPGWIVTN